VFPGDVLPSRSINYISSCGSIIFQNGAVLKLIISGLLHDFDMNQVL